MTEYLRFMYIENKYGKDSLNEVLTEYRNKYNEDIRGTEYDIPLSSNIVISTIHYLKGPLVFHWVRKQIGDENWKKFLRTLYQKYFGKVIDYNIFKQELSKYDKTGKVIKRMEEITEMNGMLPEECYPVKTFIPYRQ